MRLGYVLHLAHIDIFRWHWLQILFPVTNKVRETKHDVIRCLTCLERHHGLGIQITSRRMRDVNSRACQLGKLLGMQGCWLTDNRHGMRVDGQGTATIVLLRHRLIRTFTRNITSILNMWKLVAPLIGISCTGNQCCGNNQTGCIHRLLHCFLR